MAPLLTGTQYTGPAGAAGLGTVAARDAGISLVAYLPPLLRDLPFLPAIPNSSPPCDASFPDVLQTVHTNARVTRISTCPFQIKAEINVVSRPVQIAITPDGSMALVTSFDNAVNFIDLTTNKVVFTLTTDPLVNPMGIAITPDGKRAYITSFDPDEPVVQVIDIASHTVTATFMTTLQYPQGATLTPDGSQLWITGPLDSVVDIYDNATNTLVTRLNIGSTTDVAFNSQGTRAYITSQTNSPGVVVVVDTATFQSLKSYQVGAGPTDITMSYADQFLVVNNSLDGSVSVIDLGLNKVSTTKLGSDITGTAFVH
jgi:DNA-binding beta-propeller fold protein YncE